MDYFSRAFIAAAFVVLLSGCISTPLREIPPRVPEAGEGVTANAWLTRLGSSGLGPGADLSFSDVRKTDREATR
jgi:hypothetical protein